MTWTLPPVPTGATLAHEAVAALGVGLVFLAVILIAETWRRAVAPPVEWTRKLVHVSSGLVAAFFPWIFRTHWTLLILGACMVSLFALGRRRGWFVSITGVERASAGERWFPVGVYLLFVIARHQPVFYLIALSSLVVSDTLAALLGTRYGDHTYEVAAGRKSLEGSAAFMLATFMGVHLPLLLFTEIGRPECVVIALQLSLLATSFEAISERGNDNLVVPLATYYLLVKMTPYPWHSIGLQLIAQLALLGVCLAIAWRIRFLSFAGAIAAHLVLYAAFSLGGPGWTLAPALALAGYALADAAGGRGDVRPPGGHQVQGVFYASVVAVALLFGDNSLGMIPGFPMRLWNEHPLRPLFVAALAAPLAITVGSRLRVRRLAPGRAARWALGGLIGLMTVAPLGLWAAGAPRLWEALLVSAAVVSLAVFFYTRWVGRREGGLEPRFEFRVRALCVAAAAAIVTPFHLSWITATWSAR